MFHLAFWIYLFHRNTFICLNALAHGHLTPVGVVGEEAGSTKAKVLGGWGRVAGKPRTREHTVGQVYWHKVVRRRAYLKEGRSPGWPAAGTTDQDVLTYESEFLPSFWLNRLDWLHLLPGHDQLEARSSSYMTLRAQTSLPPLRPLLKVSPWEKRSPYLLMLSL